MPRNPNELLGPIANPLNTDLYNLLWALCDDQTLLPEPYLREIRDNLLSNMPIQPPAGNLQDETFNIADPVSFRTAMSEWRAAHPGARIVSSEWMEDQDGLRFYYITFSE